MKVISVSPLTVKKGVTVPPPSHRLLRSSDAHVHVYLASSNFDAVDRMPRSLLSQYGAAALRGALERGFTPSRNLALIMTGGTLFRNNLPTRQT